MSESQRAQQIIGQLEADAERMNHRVAQLEAIINDMPHDAISGMVVAGREAISRGGADPDVSDYCNRIERWLEDYSDVLSELVCYHEWETKTQPGGPWGPAEYFCVCKHCGRER